MGFAKKTDHKLSVSSGGANALST